MYVQYNIQEASRTGDLKIKCNDIKVGIDLSTVLFLLFNIICYSNSFVIRWA